MISGPEAGTASRYPPPLGQEDWERMVENLKKGPTPKQVEIMKEADEKWSEYMEGAKGSGVC